MLITAFSHDDVPLAGRNSRGVTENGIAVDRILAQVLLIWPDLARRYAMYALSSYRPTLYLFFAFFTPVGGMGW